MSLVLEALSGHTDKCLRRERPFLHVYAYEPQLQAKDKNSDPTHKIISDEMKIK